MHQRVLAMGLLLAMPAIHSMCPRAGFAQYDGAEPVSEELRAGFESISREQCQEWLGILAGPGFAGRGTVQEGYIKAAYWIAGKLAEFGLKPMGDAGTYFQLLPINRQTVDAAESRLTGPDEFTLPFGKDIGLDRFDNRPETTGQLVFVRMSGSSAKFDSDVSFRDKIVVLVADESAAGRASAIAFARNRPLALLRVVDSEVSSAEQTEMPGRRRRTSGLNGTITRAAAIKLAEAVQGTEAWLASPEQDTVAIDDTMLNFSIQLRVRETPVAAPNVLAWQPGSDPELSNEYLVMGAHLDHLGVRGDVVYPGADDNGSGSTALLSIAKAIASNPAKPKRSILFMWFAAEESGLVGSAHYVNNPLLPLEDMICMMNIDMVGRNEENAKETASENDQTIHLVGSKKGDLSLHDVILDANKFVNFTFEFDEENKFGRSDQVNFFRQGRSVAFLFGGLHPDYHKPTDSPDKINYQKVASAAKLYYLAAYGAAKHGPFPIPSSDVKEVKSGASEGN